MAKQRIENDYYPTERALTEYLLKVMGADIWGAVLEPCSGQGHIVKVLIQGGLSVLSSDIIQDEERYNATKLSYWKDIAPECRWVVTNPPFNQAHLIIPQAFNHAKRGIAMLLRLSYLEPCANRADWLKANSKHLRWLIIFNPRPRFRADTNGSDNVTVGWMIWDKEWDAGTTIVYANDWKS